MTDYAPIIAHAIAKLDKNTPDDRERVYKWARDAAAAALQKRKPEPSDAELATERAALENAIVKVENDALSAQNLLLAKGVIGFVAGLGFGVAIVAMLLGGADFLFGREMIPRGLGWIVMPIASGIGGWRAFREINFMEVGRSIMEAGRSITSPLAIEIGIPQSKQTATLALITAIGWTIGTLTGFFVSLAEGADSHSRTLGRWLFGYWDWYGYYFPWAGIGWGIAGVIFALAVIYARQSLSKK
jgi:hypothetical protein